ncbi:MAG: DUF1302 family protein [Trueperaceae bacterium]|nr:DUF1302 family protein [Trueperaceae bacterium]
MRRILLTIALLALPASAFAQLRTDWSGRLDARLGLESTGDLTAAGAEARLALDGEVGSEFFPTAAFRAELRAETDAATGTAEVRLDEAWGRLYLNDGAIELTAGNQRLFWGSTDGVNPVDRLNPRDLSVPPDEEKLPVPMVHLRAWLEGDVNLQVALLPVFVPSEPPNEDWRDDDGPTVPPGVTVTEMRPVREELPDAALENLQLAARAQWRPAGFDVAASYQYLFRDLPTRSAEIVPTDVPGEVILQPVARYDRIHVVGLDGSVALGDFVLRAEGAYLFTSDPDGTDPAVGNPSFQIVVGAETVVPDGPRVIAQAILDGETLDTGPGEASGDVELGLRSMLVLTYAVGARTDVEAAWVHDSGGSGMLRPRVAYTFADGVTGSLEAMIAYGAEGTRFGGWSERSGATASLQLDF